MNDLRQSKQSNYIYFLYSFIKVCEYLEYLILVQTFILFEYTGSALKNTGEWLALTKSHVLCFKNENVDEPQLLHL